MLENQENNAFEAIRKRAKERGTNVEKKTITPTPQPEEQEAIETSKEEAQEILAELPKVQPQDKTQKRKKQLLEMLDMVIEVSLAAIVFFTIHTFIASPFVVSGRSMDNTFQDKEFLLVNRFTYNKLIGNPDRGDVIIFHPPTPTKEYYIKRIIGVPGDTVSFKNDAVYLNGKLLSEPYTKCISKMEANDLNAKSRGICDYSLRIVENHSFTVPEGQYFVMGDNRNASSDSRTCFGMPNDRTCTESAAAHFVPRENIVGKAWFVFWPLSSTAAQERANGNTTALYNYLWPWDNLEFVKSYRN